MFFGKNSQLETMLKVVGTVGRGVHKRIDENRELLQLLQERVPEFLAECPWVEGWLAAQDDFLVALEQAAVIENPLAGHPSVRFPRPWPGGTRAPGNSMANYRISKDP